MVQLAFPRLERNGSGAMRFGCVEAGLEASVTADDAEFTLRGHDEMDKAAGEGVAELDEAENFTGEVGFENGDTATFKALKI